MTGLAHVCAPVLQRVDGSRRPRFGTPPPRSGRGLRRIALLGVAVLLISAALPSGAAAWYGNGAQIVSADFGRLEQGDDATQFAAMAAGGRYVAIQTRASNFFPDDDPDPPGRFRVGGIFRFDLPTRALELVADGDLRDEASNALLVRGAQNPSISADGRYVAFSTAQQLVPADVNGNVDVYVRDMSVPTRAQGAYDLASAKDGGDTPAAYAPRTPDTPGLNPGADVTRGVAISGDGSRVTFRTLEVASDLPDHTTADTPGGQVFVRDRATDRTTLVTRTSAGALPAGGAAGPALISADGTTVAWTGGNAAVQTRFVDGENTDPGFYYYLWQRVSDGPGAPTRRITGISDPDDPGCPPGASAAFNPTSTGPCYGPLTAPELGTTNFSLAPALSADGRTVAFVTAAGPRPDVTTGLGLDLYVTRMDPGLSRKAATVELTRDGSANDAEASPPVDNVAMSADGRWLAVSSARTRFLLPALSELGSHRLVPGTREIYAIDLAARTIERVTRGVDGGDANGGVVSEPTLSADGAAIGFTAFASNLLFGDANERADAFVAVRQPEPPSAPPGRRGAELSAGADVTEDLGGDAVRLPTSVRNLGKGRLELRVRVPAPGTLTAVARGAVKVGRKKSAKRVLARVTHFSPRAARVTLTVAVVRRYQPQLRRRGALPARVALTFSPSRGGRRETRSLRVTFRAKAPHKRGRSTTIPQSGDFR